MIILYIEEDLKSNPNNSENVSFPHNYVSRKTIINVY